MHCLRLLPINFTGWPLSSCYYKRGILQCTIHNFIWCSNGVWEEGGIQLLGFQRARAVQLRKHFRQRRWGKWEKKETVSLPARQVFARSHRSIYNLVCHVRLSHTPGDAHHVGHKMHSKHYGLCPEQTSVALWFLQSLEVHYLARIIKSSSKDQLATCEACLNTAQLPFASCHLDKSENTLRKTKNTPTSWPSLLSLKEESATPTILYLWSYI